MSVDISALAEVQDIKGMQAGKWPRLYSVKTALLASPTAYGPVIPPDQRVIFCDTSHWNGRVNRQTMKGAGAEGFYCKATQGLTWVDDQYNNARNDAAGILPFGSYHFLTTSSGSAQGVHFCNTMGDNPGKFNPCIDVELAAVAASIIKACAIEIKAFWGDYPLIYTSKYFWDKVTGASDKTWISSHCQLFVAHWGVDAPLLPTGWSDYVLHQYSADGNKRGPEFGAPPGGESDMDLDRCRRSWYERFFPPAAGFLSSIDAWARLSTHNPPYTGPGPDEKGVFDGR